LVIESLRVELEDAKIQSPSTRYDDFIRLTPGPLSVSHPFETSTKRDLGVCQVVAIFTPVEGRKRGISEPPPSFAHHLLQRAHVSIQKFRHLSTSKRSRAENRHSENGEKVGGRYAADLTLATAGPICPVPPHLQSGSWI